MYLRRKELIGLAIKQQQKCSMLPRVGAVMAKDALVMSTGFRGEVEQFHAERVAIEKLSAQQLFESILYTTLEPCVNLSVAQSIESCADLIIKSKIKEVVIGILDPNGGVYGRGYTRLLSEKIKVSFFGVKERAILDATTFESPDLHKLSGHGSRRIPVVASGIALNVTPDDISLGSLEVRFATLQASAGCVDLISANSSVSIAVGASMFWEITDCRVFRFSSHFARLSKNMIAIVTSPAAMFYALFKVVDIFEDNIVINWETRHY